MNQSDIKLIFKLTDHKDAEDVAKSDELKPPGKFIEKIRKLAKHHADRLFQMCFQHPQVNLAESI